MRTVASWTLATLYSMTREMCIHISSVVTWRHIYFSPVKSFTSHREFRHSAVRVGDAHRVQVQDDFPRLGLHFLYDLIDPDAVRRRAEAAQQTHLHDGHARRIQTRLL